MGREGARKKRRRHTNWVLKLKKFTSRDLNYKRTEIRESLEDGGCIIEFKSSDRKVEVEAVLVKKEDYERRQMQRKKYYVNK